MSLTFRDKLLVAAVVSPTRFVYAGKYHSRDIAILYEVKTHYSGGTTQTCSNDEHIVYTYDINTGRLTHIHKAVRECDKTGKKRVK